MNLGGATMAPTQKMSGADSEEKWRKKDQRPREPARDKYAHEYERERERLHKMFEAEDVEKARVSNRNRDGCVPRTCSLLGMGASAALGKVGSMVQGGVGYVANLARSFVISSTQQQQQEYKPSEPTAG